MYIYIIKNENFGAGRGLSEPTSSSAPASTLAFSCYLFIDEIISLLIPYNTLDYIYYHYILVIYISGIFLLKHLHLWYKQYN
jgi:hypothetical protein